MASQPAPSPNGTIDPKEAAHFGAHAAQWWDPKGTSAMLHKLNPVRLRYIRAAIDRHGGDTLLVGRAEGFLWGRPDLDETIARLQAYAGAGADCLYAPGPNDPTCDEAYVRAELDHAGDITIRRNIIRNAGAAFLIAGVASNYPTAGPLNRLLIEQNYVEEINTTQFPGDAKFVSIMNDATKVAPARGTRTGAGSRSGGSPTRAPLTRRRPSIPSRSTWRYAVARGRAARAPASSTGVDAVIENGPS